MKRPYVVSKGAAADLRDITQCTVANGGETQCRAYIAELEKAAEAVAKGEGVFKDMSSLLAGLRMAFCGKHCSFCMPQQGAAPPIILAILHERMDLMARLKSRLR